MQSGTAETSSRGLWKSAGSFRDHLEVTVTGAPHLRYGGVGLKESVFGAGEGIGTPFVRVIPTTSSTPVKLATR